MRHHLKTIGVYFDAVVAGDKTFEVRKNDRGFQRGDVLLLTRMSELTGGYDVGIKPIEREVTYVLPGPGFGIEAGYCVLGLRALEPRSDGDAP